MELKELKLDYHMMPIWWHTHYKCTDHFIYGIKGNEIIKARKIGNGENSHIVMNYIKSLFVKGVPK